MHPIISFLNNYSEIFVSIIWSIFWQSSLLIVIVTATTLLYRKASPRFKYLLWLLVIIRLFLPPSFYLPTGVGNWGRALLHSESGRIITETFQGNISNPTIDFDNTGFQPDKSELPVSESLRLNSILYLVWMLCVASLSGWLIRKLVWFKNTLKHSSSPPQTILNLVKIYSEKLGIRHELDVRVSERISSPIVGGIFEPVILIPGSILRKMTLEELAPVIVHELAHIKRYDWLINWLQVLSSIIYFFHPLLWFANRQIRIEREKACDDIVLLTTNTTRKGYVGSLLKVLDKISHRYLFNLGFVGVIEPKSNLGRRIVRIMDKRIKRATRLSIISIFTVIILFVVLLASGVFLVS